MCLKPIKLFNPTNRISKFGGQRFYIEVPCGECAECREARRTDMYFRTYYECLKTWNSNGYVYFDTLTYDNANLPHVSDFDERIEKGSSIDYSCFNKNDFRLFMVRLRRQLEYYGFDVKNKLKYFVASEYGNSDEYVTESGKKKKGTNRPHYHVLFFVTDGSLHPLTLSGYVNKCWQKGRTDGVPYKSTNYILNHTFGPRFNSDRVHMQATCNYVAKYCLKDCAFETTLRARLDLVCREGEFDGYLGKKRYRKLTGQMRPYTRWSNGFGEYGLEYNSEENIRLGVMELPDKNKVKRYAPLSGYLDRKRYYEVAYNDLGKLYWKLSDEGKQVKLERAIASVEKFADRFREWLINADNLIQFGDLKWQYDFEKENWRKVGVTAEDIVKFKRETVGEVVRLMGDRTPEDFAFYVMFYKGRVKGAMMNDPVEFFYRGLISNEELNSMDDEDVWYGYCHSKHKAHFKDYIISERRLHTSVEETVNMKKEFCAKFGFDFDEAYERKFYKKYGDSYIDYGSIGYDDLTGVSSGDFKDNYNKGHRDSVMTAEDFIKRYCIDDSIDERFRDFDRIYSIYSSSMFYQNQRKQNSYDYVEDMKRRLKAKGFLKS